MFPPDRTLAFVEMLRQSQFWPRAKMQTYQDEMLSRLVTHAYKTVPFYRDRLAPLFRRRWGPRLHKWHEVPPTTRTDVIRNHDALMTENLPPSHGLVSARESSGTSGDPVRVYRSEMHRAVRAAVSQREFEWHGVDLNANGAVIAHTDAIDCQAPDGRWIGYFSPHAETFGHTGRCCGLHWDNTPAEKANWLKHTGATLFNARPGDYRQIIWANRQAPETVTPLQTALIYGENVTPELRRMIMDNWNISAIDRYSCNELGYIALERPGEDGYRTQDETILVEIVDDANKAVTPGKTGRVLLTGLYNFAMPLIRYAPGDMAVAGDVPAGPCNLRKISQILGRDINRFQDLEGQAYWPITRGIALNRHFPFCVYQLAQVSAGQIEIRYTASREVDSGEQEIIRHDLGPRLHDGAKVSFHRRKQSPANSVSGKLMLFENCIGTGD